MWEFPTPGAVVHLDVATLRDLQFTTRKSEYILGVAQAALDGTFDDLASLSNREVVERLTAIRGIGRWSADWLLARCLARPDVVAAGDLGVRKAVSFSYFESDTILSEEVVRSTADDVGRRRQPDRPSTPGHTVIRTKTHLAALAAILLALASLQPGRPAKRRPTRNWRPRPRRRDIDKRRDVDQPPLPQRLPRPGRARAPVLPSRLDQLDITRGVPSPTPSPSTCSLPTPRDQWPVVVFFHGGSWYGGAKENVEPFAACPGRSRVRRVQRHVPHRPVRWWLSAELRRTSAAPSVSPTPLPSTYGGDPERVFVAGHSAGAHLASTVLFGSRTFSEGDCARGRRDPRRRFHRARRSLRRDGFRPSPRRRGLAELSRRSPRSSRRGAHPAYLDTALMPVLLLHGTLDELVPIVQTTDFAEALGASGGTWS